MVLEGRKDCPWQAAAACKAALKHLDMGLDFEDSLPEEDIAGRDTAGPTSVLCKPLKEDDHFWRRQHKL